MAANDVLDESGDSHAHHRAHAAPFSNGAVSHGNVLRLKMDGDIEKIEGDGQPTGFTVVIPGRRSLEPAAPLAARDGRIASIRVTNDGSGAELTVAFKDGVPNYLVRAKGDVLEIVLAPTGTLGDSAKPARATSAPAARHHHHKLAATEPLAVLVSAPRPFRVARGSAVWLVARRSHESRSPAATRIAPA